MSAYADAFDFDCTSPQAKEDFQENQERITQQTTLSTQKVNKKKYIAKVIYDPAQSNKKNEGPSLSKLFNAIFSGNNEKRSPEQKNLQSSCHCNDDVSFLLDFEINGRHCSFNRSLGSIVDLCNLLKAEGFPIDEMYSAEDTTELNSTGTTIMRKLEVHEKCTNRFFQKCMSDSGINCSNLFQGFVWEPLRTNMLSKVSEKSDEGSVADGGIARLQKEFAHIKF